jgi:hypothetical protein
MKKIFVIVAFAAYFTTYAQQDVATDSIPTNLNEVVVTADAQIETAKKVILHPSKLDKKHSKNGYALLDNMNLSDFNINASAKSISTIDGRDVRLLINGVDAQPDELATLAASQIEQIDYQRNPGGKYVGSGAVINFITVQYDYGGNVYLSADEGLARQYGEYIGMVNYKKNAVTLTLTANGKWSNSSTLNSEDDIFAFNDGTMYRSISPLESTTHTNSQYVNLKFAHTINNHSFDVALALTRSATPKNYLTNSLSYSGLYDFNSTATRYSDERGLSPKLKMNYNLYLPGGQALMAIANVSYGSTDFRSKYIETKADDIINNTQEDNVLANATLGYFKYFSNGLNIGATVNELYNHYSDTYSGSYNGKQTLTNNHIMSLLHVSQNLPIGVYYYASAGISSLHSSIVDNSDNQLSPMAYYGLNYAINRKHSLSLTGTYAHSIYDPSYKNDAVIRTSLFETTLGNPNLSQLKVWQNLVSYNGRVGHFGFSFTYDFLKYFDNTSNRYFADGRIMYHRLINDGSFYYHKFIISVTANLLDNKLRLKADALYNMNHFASEYRPAKSNDLRPDFSASYMFGDWQMKGSYALPYSSLGIEGTKIHFPKQYGLSVGWQKGCWSAECCIENFLSRRLCTRTDAYYGVYQSLLHSFSNLKGRNISISVTYILPYGKKTDCGQVETESNINSAILRPF